MEYFYRNMSFLCSFLQCDNYKLGYGKLVFQQILETRMKKSGQEFYNPRNILWYTLAMVIISQNKYSFISEIYDPNSKTISVVVNTMGRTKDANIILERKVCGVTLFFGIKF